MSFHPELAEILENHYNKDFCLMGVYFEQGVSNILFKYAYY